MNGHYYSGTPSQLISISHCRGRKAPAHSEEARSSDRVFLGADHASDGPFAAVSETSIMVTRLCIKCFISIASTGLVENDSRMIFEIFAERPVGGVDRIAHDLSVEPIVILAVFEFLTNALTDDDTPVRWIDREITLIEEAVQIASHQQTV